MTYGLEKYVSGHAVGLCEAVWIHSSVMTKVASECHTPDTLLKVIEGLRERPEGVYVLLNALGASDYYGQNRNGDLFPEWSLLGAPPPADVRERLEAWNRKHGTSYGPLGPYGHSTFVTDAKYYLFHDNKDPLQAKGDVIASAYNQHMHRVELIVFVYEARDPDGVRAIRSGQPVPFSMGARLPWDECQICFNIARNRSEYCKHLLTEMGRVYPDGRRVGAANYFPKFFDISRVRIPADRSAWSLRKVARYGRTESGLLVPSAKLGTLTKEIPSGTSRSLGSEPIDAGLLRFVRSQVAEDAASSQDLPPETLRAADGGNAAALLGALALAGIVLKPHELRRVLPEGSSPTLDLPGARSKLLMVVRAHLPARSCVDPQFAERRKTALASGAVGRTTSRTVDDGYTQYLDLLHRNMEAIVKTAQRPEYRTVLHPAWAGHAFFKQSCVVDVARAWLPFMAATRPTS